MYEDITSVDPLIVTMDNTEARFTPSGLPIRFVSEIPGAREWADELLHQRDHAIAEALVWRKRNADLAAENARLRERQRRVIELHTDSPAGPCPSCGRVGDVSDEDDGLVPWPCPTILALDSRAGL